MKFPLNPSLLSNKNVDSLGLYCDPDSPSRREKELPQKITKGQDWRCLCLKYIKNILTGTSFLALTKTINIVSTKASFYLL